MGVQATDPSKGTRAGLTATPPAGEEPLERAGHTLRRTATACCLASRQAWISLAAARDVQRARCAAEHEAQQQDEVQPNAKPPVQHVFPRRSASPTSGVAPVRVILRGRVCRRPRLAFVECAVREASCGANPSAAPAPRALARDPKEPAALVSLPAASPTQRLDDRAAALRGAPENGSVPPLPATMRSTDEMSVKEWAILPRRDERHGLVALQARAGAQVIFGAVASTGCYREASRIMRAARAFIAGDGGSASAACGGAR